ncbi:MAG: tetratricopeptide repeat protein [Akkermansiaceae bacterium]
MKNFRWCLMMGLIFGSPMACGDPIPELTVKAEAGNLEAQVALGEIHSGGQGQPKNEKEAVKWYLKAAEQGNLEAQLFLGRVYLRGRSVLKDSKESAKWYLMAAEQGSAAAQCQIARMHTVGAGVPKDDVQAYKWASLAAGQGDMAAKNLRMTLEKQMSPVQIEQAQELSRLHLELLKLELTEGEAPALEPITPEDLEPASD